MGNKQHAGGIASAMRNLDRIIDASLGVTPERAAYLTSLCKIDSHPLWPAHERYIAVINCEYSGKGPTVLSAVIAAHNALRASRA